MKKLICLVLSIVLALGFVVSVGAQTAKAAEFELDVAITFGEPATRNILAMLAEVEEKSDGRVHFNVYPSNSLISIPEIPDALRDGVADIACVPSINYPSIFSYNAEIVGLPFIGIKDNDMACALWRAMYAEFPELQEEWDQLGARVWFEYATAGYNLHTINENDEIRTPADLAGHQIMCGKQQWLNIVNANGGAGIQAPPTVYYENLEKGVSDGVVQSYSTVRVFGALELIKSCTEFGKEGSYYDMFYLAISNQTWNSLPEDIQAIFNETNADLHGVTLENQRSRDDSDSAKEEVNANIYELTEDEIQVWKDAFAPENEAYIQYLQDTYKKDKAQEMYDWAMEWIANYEG